MGVSHTDSPIVTETPKTIPKADTLHTLEEESSGTDLIEEMIAENQAPEKVFGKLPTSAKTPASAKVTNPALCRPSPPTPIPFLTKGLNKPESLHMALQKAAGKKAVIEKSKVSNLVISQKKVISGKRKSTGSSIVSSKGKTPSSRRSAPVKDATEKIRGTPNRALPKTQSKSSSARETPDRLKTTPKGTRKSLKGISTPKRNIQAPLPSSVEELKQKVLDKKEEIAQKRKSIQEKRKSVGAKTWASVASKLSKSPWKAVSSATVKIPPKTPLRDRAIRAMKKTEPVGAKQEKPLLKTGLKRKSVGVVKPVTKPIIKRKSLPTKMTPKSRSNSLDDETPQDSPQDELIVEKCEEPIQRAVSEDPILPLEESEKRLQNDKHQIKDPDDLEALTNIVPDDGRPDAIDQLCKVLDPIVMLQYERNNEFEFGSVKNILRNTESGPEVDPVSLRKLFATPKKAKNEEVVDAVALMKLFANPDLVQKKRQSCVIDGDALNQLFDEAVSKDDIEILYKQPDDDGKIVDMEEAAALLRRSSLAIRKSILPGDLCRLFTVDEFCTDDERSVNIDPPEVVYDDPKSDSRNDSTVEDESLNQEKYGKGLTEPNCEKGENEKQDLMLEKHIETLCTVLTPAVRRRWSQNRNHDFGALGSAIKFTNSDEMPEIDPFAMRKMFSSPKTSKEHCLDPVALIKLFVNPKIIKPTSESEIELDPLALQNLFKSPDEKLFVSEEPCVEDGTIIEPIKSFQVINDLLTSDPDCLMKGIYKPLEKESVKELFEKSRHSSKRSSLPSDICNLFVKEQASSSPANDAIHEIICQSNKKLKSFKEDPHSPESNADVEVLNVVESILEKTDLSQPLESTAMPPLMEVEPVLRPGTHIERKAPKLETEAASVLAIKDHQTEIAVEPKEISVVEAALESKTSARVGQIRKASEADVAPEVESEVESEVERDMPLRGRRTRKAAEPEKPSEVEAVLESKTPARGRRTRKAPEADVAPEVKSEVEREMPVRATRTRKAAEPEKTSEVETALESKTPARGRRTRKAPEPDVAPEVESEVEREMPLRGRRTRKAAEPGKTSEVEAVLESKTPARGRRTRKAPVADEVSEVESEVGMEIPVRGRRTRKAAEPEKTSEVEGELESKTPARGRRTRKALVADEAPEVESEVGMEIPVRGRRTRKAAEPEKTSEVEGELESKTPARGRRTRKAPVADEAPEVESEVRMEISVRGRRTRKAAEPEETSEVGGELESKTPARGRRPGNAPEADESPEVEVGSDVNEKTPAKRRQTGKIAQLEEDTVASTKGRQTRKRAASGFEQDSESDSKPTQSKRSQLAVEDEPVAPRARGGRGKKLGLTNNEKSPVRRNKRDASVSTKGSKRRKKNEPEDEYAELKKVLLKLEEEEANLSMTEIVLDDIIAKSPAVVKASSNRGGKTSATITKKPTIKSSTKKGAASAKNRSAAKERTNPKTQKKQLRLSTIVELPTPAVTEDASPIKPRRRLRKR